MSWSSGDDVARRRRTPTPEDPNDNHEIEEDSIDKKSHVITTWPNDLKTEDPQLLIDLMMEEMRVEAEIERMRLKLKEEREGNQLIFADCQFVIALFSLPPILIYLAVYVFLLSPMP